jgi:hypothetical protein
MSPLATYLDRPALTPPVTAGDALGSCAAGVGRRLPHVPNDRCLHSGRPRLRCRGPAAHAGPTSPTTAIVSLGDSYISGEAGRWEGNSNSQFASRDGTDRAYTGGCCSYDTSRVYLGGSDDNGCHRSDVAEILSNTIGVVEKVNLACSGATTANVIRASQGGQSHDGEAPQADQLAAVAQRDAVKLVVLSIGAATTSASPTSSRSA